MSELTPVLEAVAERVTPDADERERLERVAADLAERARAAVAELPVEADVLRVGSTARGTWLAGDRDVDLFVRFPPELDRERLEEYGLRVGRAVLPDGREEYAEHPYVTGEYDGFDVDCVPCYDVESATEIRSAVDRTPFHTAYLEGRLDDDLRRAIRLCKRFAVGIGAYGSDLRTRGFSGYLVELLIVEHGGFRPLLSAAADWSPPVRFDPEDHGTAAFDDPLVVIDPTDPERNVAAVCSAASVARFQHHARALLAEPSVDAFYPDPPAPIDPAGVRDHLDRRGTHPVAVAFDAPDLVDDQLYPQLRRSLGGVRDGLDRRGFAPLRSAVLVADRDDPAGAPTDGAPAEGSEPDADGGRRAALLVECAVDELPAVERHEGPPVGARDHAAGFHDAYADGDAYGPFLDGDRYVVERERDARRPEALLAGDDVFDVALGARIEAALREGREVLVGEEVARLADAFGVDLRRYFEPSV